VLAPSAAGTASPSLLLHDASEPAPDDESEPAPSAGADAAVLCPTVHSDSEALGVADREIGGGSLEAAPWAGIDPTVAAVATAGREGAWGLPRTMDGRRAAKGPGMRSPGFRLGRRPPACDGWTVGTAAGGGADRLRGDEAAGLAVVRGVLGVPGAGIGVAEREAGTAAAVGGPGVWMAARGEGAREGGAEGGVPRRGDDVSTLDTGVACTHRDREEGRREMSEDEKWKNELNTPERGRGQRCPGEHASPSGHAFSARNRTCGASGRTAHGPAGGP